MKHHQAKKIKHFLGTASDPVRKKKSQQRDDHVYRNDQLKLLAGGEECTYNSQHCINDKLRTVFCRFELEEWGKYGGIKSEDIGFFACPACRDVYIGKKQTKLTLQARNYLAYRAGIRTLYRLLDLMILRSGGWND